MNHLKRYLSLLLLVITVLSCSTPKQAENLRILFIGNSYTYYNSMPELLKSLILEKFPERVVETQLISEGGMTLAHHWQEESTLETIRSGEWDYVVLQEQSKLGMAIMIDNDMFFGQTEQFFEHARKFDAEVKKAGAKTAFLMTWSERAQPKEQAILTHAYSAIAKELDAILVPTGLVWDKVRTQTNLNLYDNDGTHPSSLGSYLSAITIFSTLLADSPLGLSGTISGNRLSSRGEASLDQQLLVDIPTEEAQLIQKISWQIVDDLQKSGGYPKIEKPKPSYQIPELAKGESIDLKSIIGKWYGTSTYGFNYHGQILEILEVDGEPEVRLSFCSPHVKEEMKVENASIEGNQLILTLYDPFRTRNSTIRISLNGDEMEGLLESAGNFYMYKHLNFSRETVHNGIDLSDLDLLLKTFESNTAEEGFVQAAIKHYKQYSKLIGETYKPEELYLNAVGYNYLREGEVNDALNTFKLAMTYYPQSVNTYDSYAEALITADRKDEALIVYRKAYELAKNTGYENLAYIEENLNKLENNSPVELEGEAIPPPPPPQ
ncbi:MAG: hypothetical protein Sapg2KO_14410 [Saprospiraceae bacterium]